jgi:hypothetical protein
MFPKMPNAATTATGKPVLDLDSATAVANTAGGMFDVCVCEYRLFPKLIHVRIAALQRSIVEEAVKKSLGIAK